MFDGEIEVFILLSSNEYKRKVVLIKKLVKFQKI